MYYINIILYRVQQNEFSHFRGQLKKKPWDHFAHWVGYNRRKLINCPFGQQMRLFIIIILDLSIIINYIIFDNLKDI